MPPFKDEHVLVIAPGSQTCLAQLGLPESLTPAKLRIPTRMFPAEKEGEWEPYKINEKKKPAGGDGDIEMGGTGNDESNEPIYEEDPDSDEGAVYPLVEGRITNMPCFLALLSHVYNLLSPTLNVHTPILLVAQPAWTVQDQEALTSFFFERFKTPAFSIIDAACATLYSLGTLSTATIVDVGYQKVDVTAFVEYLPSLVGRTISLPNAGGDGLTETLLELLGPKGWTKDMCEQLKKSNFCEILPAGVPLPGSGENENCEQVSNPAAAASTGATASGPAVKITEVPARTEADIDDDIDMGEAKVVENDGVLDVASIVASDKAREILAQREKEKAEKAAQRKTARDLKEKEAADAAARPIRLPNSKREKVKFWYESKRLSVPEEVVETSKPGSIVGESAENKEVQPVVVDGAAPLVESAANDEGKSADPDPSAPVETMTERHDRIRATKREEKRKERENQVGNSSLIRKEVEVGTERFLAGSKVLGLIADAVHRTISSVDDISKRSELWDSIVIVGNGSKVRGFKDGLISTLSSKYLISPSSATIFTSELPSNLTTPIGTGTNTPQREFGPPPTSHGVGVNPLLLAATTASNPALNPNQSITSSFNHHQQSASLNMQGHHSHGQTPTSLKLVKFPEYFPEWKDQGFEEAVFLGAQVAAKLFFIVDQGMSGCFVSRSTYNDDGPTAIHQVGFCF